VNELIESAVRADVDGNLERRDFDGAINTLSDYIEARPYLEHLEADLREIHLARLESAAESDEWQDVSVAMRSLNETFPNDASMLYEAGVRLANAGWLAQSLTTFEGLLHIDRSFAEREPILDVAIASLSDGWISNIQGTAKRIIGEYYYQTQRERLIENLTSEDDNLRLNSYQIIVGHNRSELESLDLFEFHRLNMVRINNYRNRGQPFDWAADYFLQLNDEARVQSAIEALEQVLTSDSVATASAILRECQETIDRLRSATVPIDVTSRRQVQPIPSRNGIEFQFDWMDETIEGAQDYAESVSIRLEIDGVVVADQSHLANVAALPRASDCTRLGTRWFNVTTQQPRQCTHQVLWRYRHPPLDPGEHSWVFLSSYIDGINGDDSFDERFAGSFLTARM
ncbi:MAG: hypothetical protein QNJ97_28720, partial [Myxococcota bacterium]|nr:hypothetical protein [Myxococcota bacterium]